MDSRSSHLLPFCVMLGAAFSGAAGSAFAQEDAPRPTAEPAAQPTVVDGDSSPAATAGGDPIIPRSELKNARRSEAEGTWQPLVLPPNDLKDPPVRYRSSRGGACLGMSAVVYGLWCSKTVNVELTLEQTVSRLVFNMIPGRDGDYIIYDLPATVLMNGEAKRLTDRETLVRLAERIQQRTMPGGADERSPAEVLDLFRFLRSHRGRLQTAAELRQYVDASGGRAVVGVVSFTSRATRYEGHVVILTLDRERKLLVWDPNARMTEGTTGSDRLAELNLRADPQGRLSELSYSIILPDGSEQQRRFTHVFEIAPLIESATLPD